MNWLITAFLIGWLWSTLISDNWRPRGVTESTGFYVRMFHLWKDVLFFFFSLETPEGKYISPFHDISLIAENEQVAIAEVLILFCLILYTYYLTVQRSYSYLFSFNRKMTCQPKRPRRMRVRYCHIPRCNVTCTTWNSVLYILNKAFFCTSRCSLTWSWRCLDGQMLKWR